MEYRREIDGLRAVAILPVIATHTQIGLLPGGFAGVDVFFVISGYLITRIVVEAQDRGTFGLAAFYARRARRLIPALATMLVVVAFLAAVLLMPSDQHALIAASAASAAYVSNVYFYLHTDYFLAPDAELLLHTWSLGVEEQFYLLYPAFLLPIRWWWPGRLVHALAIVWAASFAWALFESRVEPSAAFYLLPARMWELATGGLVACLPRTLCWRHSSIQQVLAVMGLAAIGLGFLILAPGAWFPAPGALLPCVGAALVIACGSTGFAQKLLSLAPLVLIGRWSYSLYLWHWPIAAIYRLQAGATSTRTDKVAILALVFTAGVLSHYLIERPALRRLATPRSGGRAVIAIGAAVMLGATATTWAAAQAHPVNPVIQRYDRFLAYRESPEFAYQFGWTECFGRTIAPACLTPRGDKRIILLAGDSYAAQYRRAIEERNPDAQLLVAAVTQCPPLVFGGSGASSECVAAYARAASLAEAAAPHRVILAARWDDAMLPSLSATLARLHARKIPVTVIGPTVEYDGAMPRFLAAAERWQNNDLVAHRRRGAPFALDQRMASLVRAAGADYVSQVDRECPNGVCRLVTRTGAPYHFDFGHLTLEAAREMVGRMGPLAPETRLANAGGAP